MKRKKKNISSVTLLCYLKILSLLKLHFRVKRLEKPSSSSSVLHLFTFNVCLWRQRRQSYRCASGKYVNVEICLLFSSKYMLPWIKSMIKELKESQKINYFNTSIIFWLLLKSLCLHAEFKEQLFHDGSLYHIETSPLIWSIDWFLYDRNIRHERVKRSNIVINKKCKNRSIILDIDQWLLSTCAMINALLHNMIST